MFELAPDKAAYYHMLTEKICKNEMEIEEKKNRRLNELQKQQHEQQLQQLGAGAEKNRMGCSPVKKCNAENNQGPERPIIDDLSEGTPKSSIVH
jgi:hypothetical protein